MQLTIVNLSAFFIKYSLQQKNWMEKYKNKNKQKKKIFCPAACAKRYNFLLQIDKSFWFNLLLWQEVLGYLSDLSLRLQIGAFREIRKLCRAHRKRRAWLQICYLKLRLVRKEYIICGITLGLDFTCLHACVLLLSNSSSYHLSSSLREFYIGLRLAL